MQIISSVTEMQAHARDLHRRGKTIGLVPTMGALHEGHLSLVRLARAHADVVVVSIFVNPTQFAPHEDLRRYPRDLRRDQELCEAAGVDAVFCPSEAEMYPAGFSVMIEETRLTAAFEGAQRPGHFRGVATVVAKLFNVVQPEVAVFGRKDAQQLRLIEQLVRDLSFPIRIVAGEIIREPDGLAMSSRNVNLDGAARAEAVCLRRALDLSERRCAEGVRDAGPLKKAMRDLIEKTSARVDYVEIVDPETFRPVPEARPGALVLVAARFGDTRLLDNTRLP